MHDPATSYSAILAHDRYRNQWGGEIQNTGLTASRDKSAAFEARTFMLSLSQRGVHVVIEAPTPVFKSPPFRCSDWFNRTNPVCDAGFSVSRKEIERRRSEVVEIAMAMTAAIRVVPGPGLILCSQQECSALIVWPAFFRRRSSERIRKRHIVSELR
jgi:hypothetical protein